MAIYDILPRFYQVEANNLKGLLPGFVVAQMPIAESAPEFAKEKANKIGSQAETATNLIANGHIVTISKDGIVDATEGAPLFIVYNDPLNTIVDNDGFYATDVNHEYLRLVQLIPGDEWMTDMTYNLEDGALQNRIVEVKDSDGAAKDDWFSVKTLADGTPAKHYMFIG